MVLLVTRTADPFSVQVLCKEDFMNQSIITIAGLTGSLRKGSYNRAALRAAAELMPEGSRLKIVDVSELPFLNEDEEAIAIPASVTAFKSELSEADGFLLATPEYNYSVPPVLKNALDWASRGDVLPLEGKHAAILSASPGMFGGARAQYHLRQICVVLDLLVLNRPELMISRAHEKFDADGILTDERTRSYVRSLVNALVQNVREQRLLP